MREQPQAQRISQRLLQIRLVTFSERIEELQCPEIAKAGSTSICFQVDYAAQEDIQNYLGCIHFQGHLSFINIDGHPSDAKGESTLDIQMAAGLAPAASLVVYQTVGIANGDIWVQVNDELQRIIDVNVSKPNAGSVVNISLGIDEGSITSDDVRAIDSSLEQLTLLDNMTVFVASGDCGAFDDETYVTFRSAFPPVIHGLWQLEAQIFRSIASSNVQMR